MGKNEILVTVIALAALAAVCQCQDAEFEVADLLFRPKQLVSRQYEQERLIALLGAEADIYDVQACSCKKFTCGCCLRIKMDKKEFHFDETACVMVSYLPKEIGVELKLTLNGKAVLDKKVSVKNPPPVCAAIPYVHKLASVCVRFSNLAVKDKHLSGCAQLELKFAMKTLATYNLGCFHIPPTGTLGSARMLS